MLFFIVFLPCICFVISRVSQLKMYYITNIKGKIVSIHLVTKFEMENIFYIVLFFFFLAHLAKGNESFCHHENSKPIWNKFINRKDIIETIQVVLNFCRTV
jgi:hypothetical protein